jgi:hypothetical protein
MKAIFITIISIIVLAISVYTISMYTNPSEDLSLVDRFIKDIVSTPTPDDAFDIAVDNAINISYLTSDKQLLITSFTETPTFAVIHQDDNGRPGTVIGSSNLLPAGINQNIQVNITKDLQNGETVYAILYQDNGNGEFSQLEDSVLLDSKNKIIIDNYVIETK